jgi:hypothetical protein
VPVGASTTYGSRWSVAWRGLKRRKNRGADARTARHFADRLGKRCPDAYLAPSEAVEGALQRIAGGGRSARPAEVAPVSDPAARKDDLADALLDDPTVPIALESPGSRGPDIAPPPARGDELWESVRASATSGIGEASIAQSELLMATLAIRPAEAAAIVLRGPYAGWRWLARVERRLVASLDHMSSQDSVA